MRSGSFGRFGPRGGECNGLEKVEQDKRWDGGGRCLLLGAELNRCGPCTEWDGSGGLFGLFVVFSGVGLEWMGGGCLDNRSNSEEKDWRMTSIDSAGHSSLHVHNFALLWPLPESWGVWRLFQFRMRGLCLFNFLKFFPIVASFLFVSSSRTICCWFWCLRFCVFGIIKTTEKPHRHPHRETGDD